MPPFTWDNFTWDNHPSEPDAEPSREIRDAERSREIATTAMMYGTQDKVQALRAARSSEALHVQTLGVIALHLGALVEQLATLNAALASGSDVGRCCQCGLSITEHTGDGSGGRAWREKSCTTFVHHPPRPPATSETPGASPAE